MKINKNSEDELEITNVNNVKMLTSVKKLYTNMLEMCNENISCPCNYFQIKYVPSQEKVSQ